MQPAPMNVGLRKRLSFSAVRITQKPSLDMLACVSKQLPYRYRRGNSTQRCHLDEMGHSIFYPHPPYGRHFFKCQEGPCRNLDFLLQFRGSESGVFVQYKNGPVGIKLQSKRGLPESNFRGERDLSEKCLP